MGITDIHFTYSFWHASCYRPSRHDPRFATKVNKSAFLSRLADVVRMLRHLDRRLVQHRYPVSFHLLKVAVLMVF